jgi:hypothetical protein
MTRVGVIISSLAAAAMLAMQGLPAAEAAKLKSKSKPSQIGSFSELQGITTKVDVIESKNKPGKKMKANPKRK